MKFHCVASPEKDVKHVELFKDACEKESIAFQLHSPLSFDFSDTSGIAKGDIAYRIDTSVWPSWTARAVEQFLVKHGCVTLHTEHSSPFFYSLDSSLQLEQCGLPTPKTIPSITNRREALMRYVDACGGFPVILKIPGHSGGIGVMKVNSFPSLFSIVDYLRSQETNILMRQYINTQSSARLVVLGEEVIASIQYTAGEDEFRSNVGRNKTVISKKFPAEIETIAAQAAACLRTNFAGVDILIDSDQNPHIAEVNFPCKFLRTQKVTGINIASHILQFLINKSGTASS